MGPDPAGLKTVCLDSSLDLALSPLFPRHPSWAPEPRNPIKTQRRSSVFPAGPRKAVRKPQPRQLAESMGSRAGADGLSKSFTRHFTGRCLGKEEANRLGLAAAPAAPGDPRMLSGDL